MKDAVFQPQICCSVEKFTTLSALKNPFLDPKFLLQVAINKDGTVYTNVK